MAKKGSVFSFQGEIVYGAPLQALQNALQPLQDYLGDTEGPFPTANLDTSIQTRASGGNYFFSYSRQLSAAQGITTTLRIYAEHEPPHRRLCEDYQEAIRATLARLTPFLAKPTIAVLDMPSFFLKPTTFVCGRSQAARLEEAAMQSVHFDRYRLASVLSDERSPKGSASRPALDLDPFAEAWEELEQEWRERVREILAQAGVLETATDDNEPAPRG